MAIKINNLSTNVVDVMVALSKNEGLARLLLNNIDNPFSLPVADKTKLINQKSELCRIHPFPFNPEAQVEDASFIRVYYNIGDFDGSETIQELSLFIDIVVAKSLWLIKDEHGRHLIRPYEIMDRVIDIVGKKSTSKTKLKFDGWQHLAVNTKFDAIRLYSDYFSVETNYHTYDGE